MMRQRGPTDAALSPGIYMSHSVLNQHVASNGTSVDLNHSDILNTTKPDFVDLSDHAAKSVRRQNIISKVDKSKTPNRTLVRGKIRKKRSVGRSGLHHCSGETGRGLHSLKVTIRRTCQSHKIDIDKNQSETMQNGFIDPDNQSSKFICDMGKCQQDASNHSSQTSTLVELNPSKVDAYTSTIDSCSFTDRTSGFCEPGTNVFVEGIVWLETLGMLVLNVKWRGRAYVGTLLDASRQTFSPSCPDKGITSALSLLRGGGRGRQGRIPRSRFRNHHLSPHGHHLHHLHRSFLHHHHRHGSTAGSITTRSAAAAALAASSSTEASKEGSPSKTASPSGKTSPNNPADCGGLAPPRRRGPKPRRRGFPHSRTAAATSTEVITSETDYIGSGNDGSGDSQLIPDNLPTTLPCPHAGCDKYFGDLVGLRYHLALGGHSSQEVPSPQSTSTHHHPPCSTQLIEVDIPVSAASPPKLARAQSSNSPNNTHRYHQHSSLYVGKEEEEDDDENPAPPKLQRVVSLTESQIPLDAVSNNNNEPPAPSPAYSDISDDGTLPASADCINSLSSFLQPPPHSTVCGQMDSLTAATAINFPGSINSRQQQPETVFPVQLTAVAGPEQQRSLITSTATALTTTFPLSPPSYVSACSSNMPPSNMGYFQTIGVPPPTDINRLAAAVTAYTSSLSKRSPILPDSHHYQQRNSPGPHYHPFNNPYLAHHHPNPAAPSGGTWPASNGLPESSPSGGSSLLSPLMRGQPSNSPATSLAAVLAGAVDNSHMSFDRNMQHQLLQSSHNLRAPSSFPHGGLSTKK